MKKLFFTIAFFAYLSGYAQQQAWLTVPIEQWSNSEYIYRPFTYFKDMNHLLDKFIGTWVYTQGNESFKITFIKEEAQTLMFNKEQKTDELISYYEYKKNGVTVFETYSTKVSEVSYALIENTTTLSFIYGEPSFTHPSKKRKGDLLITYSVNSNNQPILTWTRKDLPVNDNATPYKGYTTVDNSPFLAPASMVLIKQ